MNYKRVYGILIATIILLTISTQFIINYSINTQKQDGTIINYAGRQRMLSQNIAKNVLKIENATINQTSSTTERQTLNKLTGQFIQAHQGLAFGDTALDFECQNSPTVTQLFEAIQPVYETISSSALKLVTTKQADSIHLLTAKIIENEQDYLLQMDTIVFQYAAEAAQKKNNLQQLEIGITTLILIILIVEVWYIIRPVLRRLSEQNEQLNSANQQLEERNQELNKVKQQLEHTNKEIQQKNEILAQTNQELEKAKTAALETAQAKSDFLSNMSHELRTPLNGVIGMANLLAQEPLQPSQLQYLETLLFSANNLLVIINDILDFNKLDAGKVKLEHINFNIRSIVKNIHKSLLAKANEKQLNFKTYISPDTPEIVIGDPVRLGQILINLTNNAIKFTKKGTVAIQVDLEKIDQNNVAHLNFSVSDTGIGIPKDKLELIFENFSQASSTTTRMYGGTGLGLAITKRLLELQNSRIYVKSTVGKGSVFYFTLLLPIGKIVRKKPIHLQLNKKNQLKPFQSKHKVLLVEDNKINVLIAKKFLSKWNLSVEVAYNGQEAVNMVQVQPYDLVLMDISMPIMDGYEATKTIRRLDNGRLKSLPIIALTASVLEEFKFQAFEAGINDYVSKPFKPQELYNVIHKYIMALTKTN